MEQDQPDKCTGRRSADKALLCSGCGLRLALPNQRTAWTTRSLVCLLPCAISAAEIIMFDNVIVVYKYIGDLMFYVTGSQDENELILYTVLQAFYESVSILLRWGRVWISTASTHNGSTKWHVCAASWGWSTPDDGCVDGCHTPSGGPKLSSNQSPQPWCHPNGTPTTPALAAAY